MAGVTVTIGRSSGSLESEKLGAPHPEGRRTRYELADPRLAHALKDLLGVVLTVDPAACDATDENDCC